MIYLSRALRKLPGLASSRLNDWASSISVALIPLALKGVAYKPIGAAAVLRRNLLIYGLGGLIVPFVGIKLIDVIVTTLHLA